jgi:hypothetical protein
MDKQCIRGSETAFENQNSPNDGFWKNLELLNSMLLTWNL